MTRRPPGFKRPAPLAPAVEPPQARYRTWAEQAAAATSWPEWFAAERLGNPYGTPVHPLPPALDWQRNPAAPLPPDYVWARCLCMTTVVRPPGWHGQVRDVHGRLRYPVGPAVTVGDLCERTQDSGGTWHGCGAPLRQVRGPGEPYVFDFTLRDPDRHRCGRCPACLAHQVGQAAPGRRLHAVPAPPGIAVARRRRPAAAAGRFPSMAAEKAWVAAQRRLGKVS